MIQWIVVGLVVVIALFVTCRHIARGLKGKSFCSGGDCDGCCGIKEYDLCEGKEK